MPGRQRATFQKRQKEIKRLEKQREKAAKRAARRQEKAQRHAFDQPTPPPEAFEEQE
jgi:hypothetical protein